MMARLFSALTLLLLLGTAPAFAADAPSVLVQTAALKKAPLSSRLPAYGVIEADRRLTVNINFPRAGEVSRLLVSAGQVVAKGTSLLRFRTAPGASLDYQKAVSAVEYARAKVKRTERLLAQHLATRDQLAAARQALADAQSALQAQRQLGTGTGAERVTAPFDGIVTGVKVKQGDRVPAGATVLQLAPKGALQADLGVEPEQAHLVKKGMPVRITSVFDRSRTVAGRVSAVHGVINPQTRLVDVMVNIPGNRHHFLPGMRVLGAILLKRETSWTVPRSAVLRDERGAYLFQIQGGHARRVEVRTEIESGQRIGIRGPLDPSLKVVVQGNYELKDGMAVREAAK